MDLHSLHSKGPEQNNPDIPARKGCFDMHIDLDQPTELPTEPGSVSRRTVLQFLGLGAGVAAVAGATGLTRRAVDGGVFASGTGPAYAAWDEAAAAGVD